MVLKSRAAAVVLAVVAPLLAAGPSEAADPPWDVSPVAGYSSGQNYLLLGVTVPAPGDVWAVGYKYGFVGGALEFRTVVMHGTAGGTFSVVPSPDRSEAPATNRLSDVAGSSSDDVWAVGYSRSSGQRSRNLVEHWNGSAWSIWSTPDPGVNGNHLAGDGVWAVGARQEGFYEQPAAMHWDGSTWTSFPVPNPTFCSGHSYLNDVAARSSTFVLATGVCSSSSAGGDQGFVLRWNGRRWVEHKATAALPNRGALTSVSILGRAVWLGGNSPDGAFALRSRGTGFTKIPLTEPERTIAGLVARPGTAWAVGTGPSNQPPFAGPGSLRLRLTGGIPQPPPVDFGRFYAAAWDPGGRIWAVGFSLPGGNNVPMVVSRAAS